MHARAREGTPTFLTAGTKLKRQKSIILCASVVDLQLSVSSSVLDQLVSIKHNGQYILMRGGAEAAS